MEDGCVMYNRISTPPTSHVLIYDGPPKPVNASSVKILEKYCPSLINRIQVKGKNETEINTCCSDDQIHEMGLQASNLDLFAANCPSCKIAILTFGCNLACHPRQKYFIRVFFCIFLKFIDF